jgi:HPt (histidine-containing phosphotransfer) domain-containing protein
VGVALAAHAWLKPQDFRVPRGLPDNAAGQTRAFLAAGDREAAARRMHTLRSNAGFICALDLMASAGELEKAIEAGDTDVEPALSAISREIDELVAACEPWL